MANELVTRGNTLITGGTSNHLMLINVKERGLTGSKVEKLCDAIHVTLNKNTIVGRLRIGCNLRNRRRRRRRRRRRWLTL